MYNHYNEKWKDHGGCAKLKPFKTSNLDDEGAAGGYITDDSHKENDCGSDTLSPNPKRQKRERNQPFVLASVLH